MSHPYESAATRIIDWLHHAERDLLGATIATFNGEAGVVKAIKLDDHHGICFTLEDHLRSLGSEGARRWYPVSTIRMKS